MTMAVFLAVWAGALVCLVGCIVRIVQYRRTPMHLRWELYPVPHESPQYAAHGGSYFESSNWWLSRQTIRHRGAYWAMAREILLLKGLWDFNRRLWLPSFLFHFGLYLSIVAMGSAFAAGAIGLGSVAALLASACHWTGLAGIVFVLLGALWLLARRILDPALANYTKGSDIFNLLFFLATYGLTAEGILRNRSHGASMFYLARGLLHFDRNINVDPVLASGMVLAAALAAYIPFTHMSHFIAKYFTWHEVRWDDRRNVRGSAIESAIAQSLQSTPTWAASHIHGDGKQSWAEVASTNPAREKRP
jgi:nitrate reductase gamma subunit